MKKIGLFLFTALAAAVLLPSCLDDSDGDYSNKYAVATVKTLQGNDYYFQLDDATTLYPGDKSRIETYEAVDGQRVMIHFNFLKSKVEGYNYNAALYKITDILTKDPKIVTTSEELAGMGDGRTGLDASVIRGGYLTLEFSMYTWPGSKHEINLVVNNTDKPGESLDDYTTVEFHIKDDTQAPAYTTFSRGNLVSFKLGDLDPSVTKMKGIYLRITNTYGNAQYVKINAQIEK